MFQRSFLTVRLVFQQFRRAGLPWLLRRMKQEWVTPTTALGRLLYSTRNTLGRKPRTLFSSHPLSNPGDATLYAFYDLGAMPVTFDFLWFLVGTDVARRQAGRGSVHIVIVPGPDEGLRREDLDYELAVAPAARKARIMNILVAACPFLSSMSGVTVASSREQAALLVQAAADKVFPERYRSDMPRRPQVKDHLEAYRRGGGELAVIRATDSDLAVADRFLAEVAQGRRVVTITLREYNYMTARNSNLKAWAAFAERLDRSQYAVVVVRDTDFCFAAPPAELAGLTIFDAAAVNLGLRMALYERSYINLGVNNGPMCLCWLNARARYITFKILTEGVPQTTVEYMTFLGFEIGRSLPFANSTQKWVWEDDDVDIIAREFAAMSQIIDSQSQLA